VFLKFPWIINCYRNLKPDLHSLSNISCSSNNAISFLYFINRSSLILSGAVIAALAAHSILIIFQPSQWAADIESEAKNPLLLKQLSLKK